MSTPTVHLTQFDVISSPLFIYGRSLVGNRAVTVGVVPDLAGYHVDETRAVARYYVEEIQRFGVRDVSIVARRLSDDYGFDPHGERIEFVNREVSTTGVMGARTGIAEVTVHGRMSLKFTPPSLPPSDKI